MPDSYEDPDGVAQVGVASSHEDCHSDHSLARRVARNCTRPCAAGPITDSESRVPNFAIARLAAARMSASRVCNRNDPEHSQQNLRRRGGVQGDSATLMGRANTDTTRYVDTQVLDGSVRAAVEKSPKDCSQKQRDQILEERRR
jgi:hypothetical protein